MAKRKGAENKNEGPRSIQNRRARFDYHIDDTVEAGIELVGSEVKSIFLGRANLTDAYCRVINGQMYMLNMDIEPYENAVSAFAPNRRRDRRFQPLVRLVGAVRRSPKLPPSSDKILPGRCLAQRTWIQAVTPVTSDRRDQLNYIGPGPWRRSRAS